MTEFMAKDGVISKLNVWIASLLPMCVDCLTHHGVSGDASCVGGALPHPLGGVWVLLQEEVVQDRWEA